MASEGTAPIAQIGEGMGKCLNGKETSSVDVGTGVPNSTASALPVSAGTVSNALENGSMAKNGRKGLKTHSMDSGLGRGNRFMQNLPERSARGSQSRENSSNSTRNLKDMVEVIKKLHGEADNLQERIARAQCEFAEVMLKGTFLFDPTTVHILNNDHKEIDGLPDPDKVHFTRQAVNDAYIELSQITTTRPIPEPEL